MNYHLSHWPNVCLNETERLAAFKLYQENRRNQKSYCPNSCLNTNIYFGPLVSGERQGNEKVHMHLVPLLKTAPEIIHTSLRRAKQVLILFIYKQFEGGILFVVQETWHGWEGRCQDGLLLSKRCEIQQRVLHIHTVGNGCWDRRLRGSFAWNISLWLVTPHRLYPRSLVQTQKHWNEERDHCTWTTWGWRKVNPRKNTPKKLKSEYFHKQD